MRLDTLVRPLYARLGTTLATTLLAGAGMASTAMAADAIGETGRLELASTIDDGVVETVTLRNSYVDPVVVAFINTRNGDQSVQVRVSDVTGDSFSIFMEEPDGEAHNPETVSYLVMERGAHILQDGRRVEAGSIDTATTHVGGTGFAGDAVSFASAFDGAPAVLHGLNSYANGDFMASFVTGVDAAGFEIGLEAAETGASSAGETVAFIALEAGSGSIDGVSYLVGAGADGSKDGVTDSAHAIALSGFAAAPDIVVSVYGASGIDGAWARGAGTHGAAGQTVYAEEDQIRDSDRAHADDVFAFAAFAPDTDLLPATGHARWRLRLASDTISGSGNWAIRDLQFCRDAACGEPLAGAPFDSGDAFDWAPVAHAFDGDSSTFWKTGRTAAGQSYLGLDFGYPVELGGIDLDTDNVVYTPDAYFVEYYDADAAEWVVADYLTGQTDLDVAVTVRERFPTAWRVRNATEAPGSTTDWAIRDLAFCADANCATPLTGVAFDSDAAYDWAPVDNAFDGDDSTFWKTRSATAGTAFIGQTFDGITDVAGLYVYTDNVSYTPSALFVEYYDVVAEAWVAVDYLAGYTGSAHSTREVVQRERFPVAWRLRNATEAPGPTTDWAIRDLAFCADAACASPLTGAAFDSGEAYDWAPVAHAFDADDTTFWKSQSAAAGASYLGLEFDDLAELGALYVLTDNSSYTPSELYLEYFDAVSGAWVTDRTLDGFQGSTASTIVLD